MTALLKETRSLCSTCRAEVPATVFEDAGRVHMEKHCPTHGDSTALVERDPRFYKRVMNLEHLARPLPPQILLIPVTHACNLACKMCYLPQRDRPDLSLDEIKRTILSFGGEIGLTGGEPTMREDLCDIIRFTRRHGRKCLLVTNGLKLAREAYLERLEEAGLEVTLFSFNGFKEEAYEHIDGRRGLLETKLRALEVLRRHRVRVCLSITICRGVNEDQLKPIVEYALENNDFINQLRIRGMSEIGVHPDREPFALSEIADLFADAIGVSRDELLEGYPAPHLHSSAYHLYANCYFREQDGERRVLLLDKDIDRNWRARQEPGSLRQLVGRVARADHMQLPALALDKLRGRDRVKRLYVNMFGWPDARNLDLEELKRVTVWHHTASHGPMPFFAALIGNEREVEI